MKYLPTDKVERLLLSTMKKKRILIVGNDANYFFSHHLPIALGAHASGYETHVAIPVHQSDARVSNYPFQFHTIPLDRGSRKIAKELNAFIALLKLYKLLKPNLIHHITIKPVLYGGLAAKLMGGPSIINTMTGLGFVFTSSDWKRRLLRRVISGLLRISCNHRHIKMIFQNPDDLDVFVRARICVHRNAVVIYGVGIDLERFMVAPESPEPVVVMFPSRMLWEKGIQEFINAARVLRSKGLSARLVLVGTTDPNPTSVPQHVIDQWVSEGVVEYWGWRNDMASTLREAHIVCLPSYREGLSTVLIEAAASGRAIVTTDVPGCREVVRYGDNGLLVPVRDSIALANALQQLIEDSELRRRMGVRGRQIAELEFRVEKIVDETLSIYRQLLQ